MSDDEQVPPALSTGMGAALKVGVLSVVTWVAWGLLGDAVMARFEEPDHTELENAAGGFVVIVETPPGAAQTPQEVAHEYLSGDGTYRYLVDELTTDDDPDRLNVTSVAFGKDGYCMEVALGTTPGDARIVSGPVKSDLTRDGQCEKL